MLSNFGLIAMDGVPIRPKMVVRDANYSLIKTRLIAWMSSDADRDLNEQDPVSGLSTCRSLVRTSESV